MRVQWWAGYLLALFVTSTAAEAKEPLSARRLPGESYEEALVRHGARLEAAAKGFLQSVYEARRPYSELDTSSVPEWRDEAQLARGFVQARDARFLFSDEQPTLARRSSWLYPDDGCFARAALAGDNLERWGYVRPAKVFSFGSLRVETANSPSGEVQWWYHVAPLVKVAGELYVIDPALEAKKALTLREWLGQQGAIEELAVSVCAAGAYTPDDACASDGSSERQSAMSDQKYYLSSEWGRQVELGRDPWAVLGDRPLWSE